ncbi:response regulator receiver sensor hybrid histidine kinase [Haliangium ochraceum DSM 14365]|uniref:histidine kinase n=2 Tax=Haliangium ochraceum TaxID=80816 RepID=D0LG18_HALO1|nr:response regulator receiver sensor hybrid histidine kinase [Haliangium ochraceum DSM 14365]
MASDVDSPVGDILVVDDNQSNIAAVEVALEDLATRLVKACSGEEALRHLLHEDFAVILLDVQMPSMDGFETARLIRARKRTKHVPIIFVTAFDQQDEDVLEGYSLGAVDFLFKPIVPEVLRAKVAVFVELKRRRDEIARQAELLREHERLEHQRSLEEVRQRWEADMLRRQMEQQKRAATQIAAVNEQLKIAGKRKDEFIAMLAHELRNPLAPIVIGIELMESQNLTDPLLVRIQETMKRQVEHLTRLVDDLLDVSRITSGKIELRREMTPLAPIVEQATDAARPALEAQAHRLFVEMPSEPIELYVDAARIIQVVANLLNNAVRYTEPGGEIRLRCAREDDDVVSISVIDNGQGIEPEFIERIFDMFVQKRQGGPGLGLGLTLVRRLIEMHGGTVAVRSEGAGTGSTFEVRLPIGAEEAARAAEAEAGANAGEPERAGGADGANGADTAEAPPALRIVVIDDSEDIRDMASAILAYQGHEVRSAGSGSEGLELVLGDPPDVVFIDIGMPGMDGYEVARQVRARAPGGGPRLVAMTGFGQAQDRKRAFEAGFNAHLVKPTTQERLLRVLTEE